MVTRQVPGVVMVAELWRNIFCKWRRKNNTAAQCKERMIVCKALATTRLQMLHTTLN
jgi:hypothetical protein